MAKLGEVEDRLTEATTSLADKENELVGAEANLELSKVRRER